jgi:hypothetical protein
MNTLGSHLGGPSPPQISPLEHAGFEEFRCGGHGGGVLILALSIAQGGGGKGPALACIPTMHYKTEKTTSCRRVGR